MKSSKPAGGVPDDIVCAPWSSLPTDLPAQPPHRDSDRLAAAPGDLRSASGRGQETRAQPRPCSTVKEPIAWGVSLHLSHESLPDRLDLMIDQDLGQVDPHVVQVVHIVASLSGGHLESLVLLIEGIARMADMHDRREGHHPPAADRAELLVVKHVFDHSKNIHG